MIPGETRRHSVANGNLRLYREIGKVALKNGMAMLSETWAASEARLLRRRRRAGGRESGCEDGFES
jgi:hypothetical protein